MKLSRIFTQIATLLFCFSLSAQSISEKDLLGFWEVGTAHKIKWNFIDRSTVLFISLQNGSSVPWNFLLQSAPSGQLLQLQMKADSTSPILIHEIQMFKPDEIQIKLRIVKYYNKSTDTWIEKISNSPPSYLTRKNN